MQQISLIQPAMVGSICAPKQPIKKKLSAQSTPPKFLEFFAGSGLVAEGLRSIYTAAWANDNCAKKQAVYTANHSADAFHLGSIADVSGQGLPKCELAWASFPCQDLSLAGLAAGINASRSGLVWQWLRVIDEMPLKPKILVAENVVGLVSAAQGEHYKRLHLALTQRGYKVGAMHIDAAHWVPQSRPRIFVVAVAQDAAVPQQLVADAPNWLHSDAIQRVAAGLNDWVWWNMPQPRKRRKDLSEIIDWDAPFADPTTNARNIKLIATNHRAVLDGLPRSRPFVAPGYRRTRNGQQVLELRFDNVAGCLRTPEGGSSRQFLVIKNTSGLVSRLITIREAARLMGAPDTYQLPGSYNDGYKAMGDAVAVPVAKWLATHLLGPITYAN
jgi:DNA (cytosine-5)-methyltransferase 1